MRILYKSYGDVLMLSGVTEVFPDLVNKNFALCVGTVDGDGLSVRATSNEDINSMIRTLFETGKLDVTEREVEVLGDNGNK